jgi:PPM family protein phosphatase
MSIAALTDPGCENRPNQDRFLAREFDNHAMLLVVADGMGGVAGGEVAAEIAVQTIGRLDPAGLGPDQVMLRLVHTAEEAIMARAEAEPERRDMGTTLTVVLAADGQARWAHVGDCRLYHLAGKTLRRMTRDQNLAQFMVDEGELTPSQAQGHPLARMLDQCLGCGDCRPAFGAFPVAAGDLLLVCSDGLHGMVTDQEIEQMLTSDQDLETKARALLDLALERRAPDNVTLVLAGV